VTHPNLPDSHGFALQLVSTFTRWEFRHPFRREFARLYRKHLLVRKDTCWTFWGYSFGKKPDARDSLEMDIKRLENQLSHRDEKEGRICDEEGRGDPDLIWKMYSEDRFENPLDIFMFARKRVGFIQKKYPSEKAFLHLLEEKIGYFPSCYISSTIVWWQRENTNPNVPTYDLPMPLSETIVDLCYHNNIPFAALFNEFFHHARPHDLPGEWSRRMSKWEEWESHRVHPLEQIVALLAPALRKYQRRSGIFNAVLHYDLTFCLPKVLIEIVFCYAEDLYPLYNPL